MDRSVTLEKSDLNNTNFLENQDYYLNLISELIEYQKKRRSTSGVYSHIWLSAKCC